MKNVYDKNYFWTSDASDLDKKIQIALDTVIEDALKEYTPEAVYFVASECIKEKILLCVLDEKDKYINELESRNRCM